MWLAKYKDLLLFLTCCTKSEVRTTQKYLLISQKLAISWAASKAVLPAGRGRSFCLSSLPLWDPTWSAASCPDITRISICWTRYRGRPHGCSWGWGTWGRLLPSSEEDWESWGCSALGKGQSRETLEQPSSSKRELTRNLQRGHFTRTRVMVLNFKRV